MKIAIIGAEMSVRVWGALGPPSATRSCSRSATRPGRKRRRPSPQLEAGLALLQSTQRYAMPRSWSSRFPSQPSQTCSTAPGR